MQIAENAIADGMSMEGNEFQESISAIIKDKWQILDEKSDSPNRYWYLIEKLNGANIEQD